MSAAREHIKRTTSSAQYDERGELFFRRAFSHAAIGLALVDLDGNFVYTNAAYSKITGYSAAELKKLGIARLMRPEDAKVNAVFRKKMLAGKIPGYVLEKRYIRKDGSLIWVKSSVSITTDSHGKPVHIVGLTEDIDERHKAEEALRESEARFRFMAESMPQKVFTADPTGAIDYLSPQWEEYTGISSHDMDYHGWTQALHPGDREANFTAWRQVLSSGESFYFEHRLRRSDGAYRWHVTCAYAMRGDDGAIIKWIGSSTDIEELRQHRNMQARLHTLAEQREQLISMNKLKDEFIMLASHQLRTPATGVKQYISMLLQGYSDAITENQRRLLQCAFDSNERQIKIVDDLLRVARVDAGQIALTKAPCDIVQLIHDLVAQQHAVFYGRQQRIVFTPCYKELTATIDTRLMYVVLENLLDNASKYSPAGKVTTVDLVHGGDFLNIEVKDSGVGIRKKDQERLFQKFTRLPNPLSEAVSGTGLGLYWAKKIVELHGGTLEVVSRVRQGSTFRVRIPVV